MDDGTRYKKALQQSLLADGWEKAFDHSTLRAWVEENRKGLALRAREMLGTSSRELEERFAQVVEEFEPETEFDLPTTEAIFRPLFTEVEESARAIGLQPIRHVELVTSTSISPSPLARPTTGTHQLFIGPGTSAFCNYWSKAYTAIVKSIAAAGPPYGQVTSLHDLLQRTKHDPEGIVAAARLSLHFSVFGTVLGFGEYKQPPDYLAYRLELLRAMEVFALAHEYAHFVAEERQLQFRESESHSSDYALELFCDELGLQLCREWASRNDSWLAFAGVGAVAFFYAIATCERFSRSLAAGDGEDSGRPQRQTRGEGTSHPESSTRAENIVSLAIAKTADDQKVRVAEFVREYALICRTVCCFVADTASH